MLHVAPHSGTVCVKKILKLDVAIAGLPTSSITASWVATAACHTEMVKWSNGMDNVLYKNIHFYVCLGRSLPR